MSDAVLSALAERRPATLEAISAFIRQPSVSLEQQALPEGAEHTAAALRAIGCKDAEVVDVGDPYPGVWGTLDFGRPKTLLIYGHYDVRPVGTEPWTHDPFSGEVTAFDGFDKVVMGRGAAAKGPLMSFLHTVKATVDVTGTLPVNLVFAIEGAEILGSPNFPALVEARGGLEKVTGIFGPRASQTPSGLVGFSLGYKGLVYLDIVASATNWGRGPDGGSVHSATNVVVDNPAWRLIAALSTLVDTDSRIRPKSLRQVLATDKEVAEWEAPLVADLAARIGSGDPNGVLPGLNPSFPVLRFREGLTGEALARRYLYGPAMNISSLRAGYTGPGTKSFLLPHEAIATVDLRAISDVPALELIAIIRNHLEEQGFGDIEIVTRGAYDWNQTPLDADLIAAAVDTHTAMGHEVRPWPMQAFGGPWAHYGKVLGVPSLQGGAPGLGARAATSDEYFVLEGKDGVAGLDGLERFYVAFLERYGSA